MNQRRIDYRQLVAADLARIGEIDRTERIDVLYVQHGTRLEELAGDWSSPPWKPEGQGEHSVAAQQASLESLTESGAIALGAFDGDRLVGIGVLVPHLRSGVSQLAYLHVSDGYRASGIGSLLSDQLERMAIGGGHSMIVVSATPSQNTVRFYRARGYELMAEPLPELYALEPEDVHLQKHL